MPPNPRTQALLDEVRSPKACGRSEVDDSVVAFLPVLAKARRQAAEMQSLAQHAEIVEDDDEIRGRMELYIQKAGAIQRICGKIEKELRDLATSFRNLERQDADVRERAQEKGYRA